jgi:hypothetical protein
VNALKWVSIGGLVLGCALIVLSSTSPSDWSGFPSDLAITSVVSLGIGVVVGRVIR